MHACEQSRPGHWQLSRTTLSLGRLPLLMGIVNVTPDSFSDGGQFCDPGRAAEQALRLVDQGADLIDLGGESTRPYSQPVPEDEELRRVVPVLDRLRDQLPVPLSIDTSKAAVAGAALDRGAQIVNDVAALADPALLDLARRSRAGVCAMHMQGTPRTMQDDPRYDDVVSEVQATLAATRDRLLAAGIEPGRLALDPGIGFGKTHAHNLALLAACRRFHALGCPLLVGHSRKGFIGHVLGDKQAERTYGSVGVALSLARQGVQILRVHDVAATRQALLLFAASGGLEE